MPKIIDDKLSIREQQLEAMESGLYQEALDGIKNNDPEKFNELSEKYPELAKIIVLSLPGNFEDERLQELSSGFSSPEIIDALNTTIFEKNQLTSTGAQFSLEAMSQALLSSTPRPFTPAIDLTYSKSSDVTAYTDGSSITINCANPIIDQGKNLDEKWLLEKGVCVHEVAHILYTDFNELVKIREDLLNKKLPVISDSFKSILPSNFDLAYDLLKNDLENGLIPPSVLMKFISQFQNIIEDGHIEDRILREFVGEAPQAMSFCQNKFYELQEPLEVIDSFVQAHPDQLPSSGLQVLLTYAKYNGRVKKSDSSYNELNSEAYKFAQPALDLALAATLCDSAPQRNDLTFAAFVSLYPSMKEDIIKNIIKGKVEFKGHEEGEGPGPDPIGPMEPPKGPIEINIDWGEGGMTPPGPQESPDWEVHLDQSVEELTEEYKKMLEAMLENIEDIKKGGGGGGGSDGGIKYDEESQRKLNEAMKKAFESIDDELREKLKNQTTNDVDKNIENGSGSPMDDSDGRSLDDALKELEERKNGSGSDSSSGSASGDGEQNKIEVGAPSLSEMQDETRKVEESKAAAKEHDELNDRAKESANSIADGLEKSLEELDKKISSAQGNEKSELQAQKEAIEEALGKGSQRRWYSSDSGFKDVDTGTTKMIPKQSELNLLGNLYHKMYGERPKNGGLSPIELGRALAEYLMDMLQEITTPSMKVGTTSGSLNIAQVIKNLPREMSSPDPHFFQKLGLPITEDFCRVAIVIDNSGSMDNDKAIFARQSAVMLCEFCEALGIPYYVSFFSDGSHSNLDLTDFDKTYGEQEKYMLANNKVLDNYMGGTDLLPPLLNLYTRLGDVEESMGTLLFVISDGQTNNVVPSVEMLRKLENDRNCQSIIMSFPDNPYGYSSTSVYQTWQENFRESAPIIAATEGISLSSAYDEAVDMAARSLVDIPDLSTAPEILAEILYEKIYDLIMQAQGVV